MKQGIFEIIENERLTASVMKMTLRGDVSAITAPGQFINIKLDGLFLRRPISVFDLDAEAGTVTIIYKVVGKGTEQMREMTDGQTLDVLTGLGNGYDTTLSGDAPVLIGGGVGVPPLYLLAKRLLAEGKSISVVLGFNTAGEIFCEEDFRALGEKYPGKVDVYVTTVDGSAGTKGFVTDAEVMKKGDYTHFYTCGPEPMLRAVWKNTVTDGQMSFEERMGCGFGACMGCSCKTLTGYKRICRDGPVMRKGEITWEK